MPTSLWHAKFPELRLHLLQAKFFALIHRLIKSVPMQNLHAQNHFWAKSAFGCFPECSIKGLNLVAGRARFLGFDPLGDLLQVVERLMTLWAPRLELVAFRLMCSTKL